MEHRRRARSVFVIAAGALIAAAAAAWLAGVHRAAPAPVAAETAPSGNGDVNADAAIDISDPVYLLEHLFLAGPAPVPIAEPPVQDRTAIIVRHAEKDESNPAIDDSHLSEAGQERAGRLRTVLALAKLDVFLATNYLRTVETIQPAAADRSATVRAFDDAIDIIAELRALPAGSAAAVCGNRNNVPGMIAALGATEPVGLDKEEYDRLWIVRFGAEGTPATLISLRY